MIARLYDYFGVLGCASIVVWAVALLVLVGFVRHRKRGWYYVLALELAVIGWVLAVVNSERVSSVRLAEEPLTVAPVAADEVGLEAGVPAYRQQGKQQRTAGKTVSVETGVAPPDAKAERTFKEDQLLEANRLDRWNLLLARGTLWLALLALITDYLARFNRTIGGSYPLPLAAPWLDRLVPKPLTVWAGTTELPPLLETFVRRRETFLYFTAADPWPEPALPRLGKYWPLPKLVYGVPADAEFYFDAVWFNRYCVLVPAANAAVVFRQLAAYLQWRKMTKAAARQTVTVAWDLPEAPPVDLRELFGETNFRFLVRNPAMERREFAETLP
ncbi:MAG: hypothetical protein PCFJNLEI_02254 [Verrucomicrobiae bacterium]|nr:hypothetical protein [Verrucomicrobiae bacterium]